MSVEISFCTKFSTHLYYAISLSDFCNSWVIPHDLRVYLKNLHIHVFYNVYYIMSGLVDLHWTGRSVQRSRSRMGRLYRPHGSVLIRGILYRSVVARFPRSFLLFCLDRFRRFCCFLLVLPLGLCQSGLFILYPLCLCLLRFSFLSLVFRILFLFPRDALSFFVLLLPFLF